MTYVSQQKIIQKHIYSLLCLVSCLCSWSFYLIVFFQKKKTICYQRCYHYVHLLDLNQECNMDCCNQHAPCFSMENVRLSCKYPMNGGSGCYVCFYQNLRSVCLFQCLRIPCQIFSKHPLLVFHTFQGNEYKDKVQLKWRLQ